MRGSLHLYEGVLWVGRHEKTAHVAAFDLDGRPVGRAFSFRNPGLASAAAAGLAVDPDHRVWVADTPSGRLRAFSLFGRELAGLGGEPPDTDRPGGLTAPVDVELVGLDRGEEWLAVACGGRRRHAVQVVEEDGRLVESLRPLGDPRDRFAHVVGLAARGRILAVAEAGAERVQVFRDEDFHFAFRPSAAGLGSRPTAVAVLADGRMIVAVEGSPDREEAGLLLVDGGGRPLAVLAGPGRDTGAVAAPAGLAVLDEGRDRESRLFVLDRDGERVQVFNLEGICYGAFESLTGS